MDERLRAVIPLPPGEGVRNGGDVRDRHHHDAQIVPVSKLANGPFGHLQYARHDSPTRNVSGGSAMGAPADYH